jgi:hypothetical protein
MSRGQEYLTRAELVREIERRSPDERGGRRWARSSREGAEVGAPRQGLWMARERLGGTGRCRHARLTSSRRSFSSTARSRSSTRRADTKSSRSSVSGHDAQSFMRPAPWLRPGRHASEAPVARAPGCLTSWPTPMSNFRSCTQARRRPRSMTLRSTSCMCRCRFRPSPRLSGERDVVVTELAAERGGGSGRVP